jgi:predicted transcriptional regulator
MTEPKIITKTVEVIDHAATGAACRKWRVAMGQTATAVAGKLHISPSMVSDLELGRKNWNDVKLEEYVDAVKRIAEVTKQLEGVEEILPFDL